MEDLMENDIDFKGVIAHLQGENEALRNRLILGRISQLTQKSIRITRSDIVSVIQDKRFWIGAAVGVIFAISYGIAPFFVDVFRIRRG